MNLIIPNFTGFSKEFKLFFKISIELNFIFEKLKKY
jgi:hypothetical protein